jgi:hypothetical protein
VERGGEREMMISLWARASVTGGELLLRAGETGPRTSTVSVAARRTPASRPSAPRKVAPPERHPSMRPPALVNARIYSRRTTTSCHCDRASSRVLSIRPHRRRAPHPSLPSLVLSPHPHSASRAVHTRFHLFPSRPTARSDHDVVPPPQMRAYGARATGRRVCSPVPVAVALEWRASASSADCVPRSSRVRRQPATARAAQRRSQLLPRSAGESGIWERAQVLCAEDECRRRCRGGCRRERLVRSSRRFRRQCWCCPSCDADASAGARCGRGREGYRLHLGARQFRQETPDRHVRQRVSDSLCSNAAWSKIGQEKRRLDAHDSSQARGAQLGNPESAAL